MTHTYRLYIWVAGTHYPYIRPICIGVKNVPVYTGRKYGAYIRAVFMGSVYRALVGVPQNYQNENLLIKTVAVINIL